MVVSLSFPIYGLWSGVTMLFPNTPLIPISLLASSNPQPRKELHRMSVMSQVYDAGRSPKQTCVHRHDREQRIATPNMLWVRRYACCRSGIHLQRFRVHKAEFSLLIYNDNSDSLRTSLSCSLFPPRAANLCVCVSVLSISPTLPLDAPQSLG